MDRRKLTEYLQKFPQNFGPGPVFCSRAPGRVNLIGEHTDYNGGFVMPMAVDRHVAVLFRPVESGPVRLWAENYGEWDEFGLDDISHNDEQSWANYVRGVALALQEAGHSPGPFDGVVFGDLPVGAGLSSSAAIEVAVAGALCHSGACEVMPKELALICQAAENRFVGVNCGIMDQYVSIHAQSDHALLLDCRSLEHELLPLNTSVVKIVVCNTMVHHELGSSAYNQRRARCEEAARILNDRVPAEIKQLRDVSPEMLEQNRSALDELTYRRARHVVTEDARALCGAQALRQGDYLRFGRLMFQSHASLRDDYEVSCVELDVMVEAARRQEGVFGARMVGAGFGGCTVNLVASEAADTFAKAMERAYEQETGIEPEVYQFVAVDGAAVERC